MYSHSRRDINPASVQVLIPKHKEMVKDKSQKTMLPSTSQEKGETTNTTEGAQKTFFQNVLMLVVHGAHSARNTKQMFDSCLMFA